MWKPGRARMMDNAKLVNMENDIMQSIALTDLLICAGQPGAMPEGETIAITGIMLRDRLLRVKEIYLEMGKELHDRKG